MTNTQANIANTIPEAVRAGMTIMPPPQVTVDGRIVPYPSAYVQRYADLRAQKQKWPIYIEEMDADDGSVAYGYPVKFRLLIRCMASDADLQVVLYAARHLNLISSFRMDRHEAEGLSAEFEANFFEVSYTCGMSDAELSDGVSQPVPVFVPYARRRQIWVGLFEAAGYNPQWGNALNIRRRKL